MRVVFLSITVAQIMNALAIQKQYFKDDDCDFLVREEYIHIVQQYQTYGSIKNIYRIPSEIYAGGEKVGIKKQIQRITVLLKYKNLGKTLPIDVSLYDQMLISSNSIKLLEFYYLAKRKNKNIQLSLYEEGTLEYCLLSQKKKWSEIAISYACFGRYYLNDCVALYVHQPKYIKNNWSNINIVQISRPAEELIKEMNKSFGYEVERDYFNNKKYVYLEQCFITESDEKKQREIMNIVSNLIGKDKLVVKKHPRSAQDKYGEEFDVVSTMVPLELIGFNTVFDSKVFLTIASSSALNLRFILDSKCKVIFLFRLFKQDDKELHQSIISKETALIERLLNTGMEGVYIPQSINELKDVLVEDECKEWNRIKIGHMVHHI